MQAGLVAAHVEDEQLAGRQTATFDLTPEGTVVAVELEYRLKRGNVLLDVLFVRRALRDALRRTVVRYAREAAAEAALADRPPA